MSGVLDGIRVIDMSRVLAGPWAGQLLADYGADVIKVERPGSGDDTRHWGPPWIDEAGAGDADAAYFLAANRNKRSITCNLAHKDGLQMIRDLAASSDVLIENYNTGTMSRFGIDAEQLRSWNPRLIYCTISAFHQKSSRASERGYDAMVQASAGLMSLTGDAGEAGGAPQKVGVAVADIMAGMYAATAILAALNKRQATGQGQHIEVPLFDSQVAWLANQGMNYLIGGEVPARIGSAHPNIAPYQTMATADGHLMLAVGNDSQFASLVSCLDDSDLADSERFRTNANRVANRRALTKILEGHFSNKTSAEWLTVLDEHGVPAGPIRDLEAVFSDPYVAERELVRQLPHPVTGSVPTLANPVAFSDNPVEYREAPPVLGQHTVDVLRDVLGYPEQKIAALADAGAI